MWKAFGEMEVMGWIGARKPRMFAVQATGCAPMVRAFAGHAQRAEEWPHPHTAAAGLRVPSAIGDFLILRTLRESQGSALAVEDAAMFDSVRELAETEGVMTSPEGGATLAGLKRLLADGLLSGYETVVLFLTASGYKYLDVFQQLIASA
jgi:threonine synthase